jgi:hypothetical protein
MSRFDDELRRAAAALAEEPLPEQILDEALDQPAPADRWPLFVGGAAATALIAVVVGIGIGEVLPTGTPVPSPSVEASGVAEVTPSQTPEAVVVRVEEHEIRLTLELDRGEIPLGGRVWADVTVENVGGDAVHWTHGGCMELGAIRAFFPLGEGADYGRTDWTGDADELKRMAVDQENQSTFGFTPEQFVGVDEQWACTAAATQDRIEPGDSVTMRGAWDPQPADGAWPGEYRVEATFAFDGRGDRPPEDDVERQGLRVSTPLVVTGPDAGALSAGQAMDRLLDDDEFRTILARFPVDRWHPPQFGLQADAYHLTLLIAGEDSRDPVDAIRARVDAFTGEVMGVSLHSDVVVAPPVPPAEPITRTVEDQGIRLTVTLDRQRTVHGQRVIGVATVENVGEGTVFWGHSSTCAYPVALAARPDDPAPVDLGRSDWPGDLRILKDVSVHHWIGTTDITYGFLPQSWLDFTGPGQLACTSDFVLSEIPQGGSLEHVVGWDSLGYHDMPPPPGSYTVDAAFAFESRGAPPAGDGPADRLMVRLALPLEIVGPAVVWLSPGQAMDRLFGDVRFTQRLEEAPRGRWTRQDLTFEDGFWNFALYLTETDRDSEIVEALLARVDAVTGEVLSVQLDPDARPPGE